MIVCFLGYLLAVSVFFTTFAHKIYVVLKMEKVYAHRESGVETNIIGCATYDLKLGRFKAQYKGQMELYLRWLEANEMEPGEETPLGLLLCTEGSEEQIELLQLDKSGIKVAQYMTELPPRDVLMRQIQKSLEAAKARFENYIEEDEE